MNIKKHIPNFLTCCNLLCGVIGIYSLVSIDEHLVINILKPLESTKINIPIYYASLFIFAGCIFDFFDGFAARILKVSSPIGKELDSLADVVTFGVLPGFILAKLFTTSMHVNLLKGDFFKGDFGNNIDVYDPQFIAYASLVAFLIPVFSALRLAKFNIDTRQSESFIGLPTPANAILISSLPFMLKINFTKDELGYFNGIEMDSITQIILNPYFLIGLTLILCYLLVAELPLFALKFKSFKWTDNKIRYIFLISSLILLIILQWTAIPNIIFLYIILSIVENKLLKPKIS